MVSFISSAVRIPVDLARQLDRRLATASIEHAREATLARVRERELRDALGPSPTQKDLVRPAS